MRGKWLAAITALLLAESAWGALATTWEMDFDDDKKSWKELEAQLPAYPKANLVLMDMGAIPHQFYVDPASVSLGADGVTRYTAVVKAAGGAINVTFEGMRCDTRELKIYATGHRDGTWSRARVSQWERMQRHTKPYQYTLYREYFCPSPARPTPPKQALDAMRNRMSLGSSSSMDE